MKWYRVTLAFVFALLVGMVFASCSTGLDPFASSNSPSAVATNTITGIGKVAGIVAQGSISVSKSMTKASFDCPQQQNLQNSVGDIIAPDALIDCYDSETLTFIGSGTTDSSGNFSIEVDPTVIETLVGLKAERSMNAVFPVLIGCELTKGDKVVRGVAEGMVDPTGKVVSISFGEINSASDLMTYALGVSDFKTTNVLRGFNSADDFNNQRVTMLEAFKSATLDKVGNGDIFSSLAQLTGVYLGVVGGGVDISGCSVGGKDDFGKEIFSGAFFSRSCFSDGVDSKVSQLVGFPEETFTSGIGDAPTYARQLKSVMETGFQEGIMSGSDSTQDTTERVQSLLSYKKSNFADVVNNPERHLRAIETVMDKTRSLGGEYNPVATGALIGGFGGNSGSWDAILSDGGGIADSFGEVAYQAINENNLGDGCECGEEDCLTKMDDFAETVIQNGLQAVGSSVGTYTAGIINFRTLNGGGVPFDPMDFFNDDNSTAGFVVSLISGSTTEAGGTATFTFRLSQRPSTNVTIALSSSNIAEGTVTPASLAFTPANWDVRQIVTVTGVDDNIDDGTVPYSIITGAAASSDSYYSNRNPNDVPVANIDNDAVGFTISPISGNTTEAGGTATFTVALNIQPLADVIIGLASLDLTEGTVAPAALTFTSGNWNDPQEVTVTGVNDNIDDGNIDYSIVTAAALSEDASYNSLNPNDVSVINVDNDTASIVTSKMALAVSGWPFPGTTDSLSVHLGSEPTGIVTMTLSLMWAAGPTAASITVPASKTLVFTPINWNVNQTVTVQGMCGHLPGQMFTNGNLNFAADNVTPEYSGFVDGRMVTSQQMGCP